MRILLDTHTFLWVVNDDVALPSSFRQALLSGEHQFFLSVASLWEIAIKATLCKLTLPFKDMKSAARFAEDRDTHLLPVLPGHLDRLLSLPMHHRDPFDRIILCQAIEEDMVLATVDVTMQRYDVSVLN